MDDSQQSKKQLDTTSNKPLSKVTAPDMSPEEIAMLEAYIDQGLPGIGKVTETSIFSWFNLYMNGRSYSEIAKETRSNLEQILCISNKYGWYNTKTEHYKNLMARIENKMTTTKAEGLSFLYDLLSFTHQLYSDDVVEFLKTKNKDVAARVDLRVVDRYVKIVDAINKVAAAPEEWVKALAAQQGNKTNVNINIGTATIKNMDDDTIDISPTESIVSQLAELKKKKEQ